MATIKQKINIGDTVIVRYAGELIPNKVLEIKPETIGCRTKYFTEWHYEGKSDLHKGWYALDTDYTIVEIIPKDKPSIMASLTNMMKKLLDKDTQVLVKAGYINGDLLLTEKGEEALFAVLFTQNKTDLVTLAQAELDEKEKSK